MKQLLPSLLLCFVAFGGHAQHICISQLGLPAEGMAEQLENDLQRWLQQHPQAASAREVVKVGE
ncbi:MAG: hypothetical protein K9J06_01110 [Flavobacteriales bacterium]|nr:hypothetical protein [Flavobacteriales bacterium]